MDADLKQRLVRLGEQLVVPREDDGTPAELAALMPCEPAIGEMAVACWSDSEGGELVELVSLADGARVDDAVALREALVLLAMVETVEELASFAQLAELAAQLRAWTVLDGADDPDAFARAREAAVGALDALVALAPGEVRMARTQRLDELGAALRALEAAWTALETAAESWSDQLLAARGSDDSAATGSVQSLWRVLGTARRGPLARTVTAALHEAREAGFAMAAAVAAAG